LGDPGADQCRANALTLKRWLDRERTEPIKTAQEAMRLSC
jgi:hypothetical protein